MVQSLESTLDPTLDEAVRAEWQILSDAGLPSQGHHRGASNRPHITLVVADALDELDARIDAERVQPTVPVHLGAFVVFRGKFATLARLVVPSPELLMLHDTVARLTAGAGGHREHTHSGRWTPHVTIARRLTPTQLIDAIIALESAPSELEGRTSTLRRWDGESKREWFVGPR